MFRLTRKRMSRVSNRLAVFAALLLLVSSIAGVGSSALGEGPADSLMAATSRVEGESIASQTQTPVTVSKSKRKGFKMNLFLFRHK